MALKTDSLSQALEKNEAYLKGIQKVLTGKLERVTFNKDSILAQTQKTIPPEALKAGEAELDLRKEVAEEEKRVTTKGSSNKK